MKPIKYLLTGLMIVSGAVQGISQETAEPQRGEIRAGPIF